MAWSGAELMLEARGLNKNFGDVKAVQGVNLSIARGECLALLGPNGAGKTTTVEMLEGLTRPDSGEVLVGGKSLQNNRREIMQRVGVLLQETNLYKRYSVRETLAMFGALFERSLHPELVIQRLSLGEKRDVQLRHLSGGQKQRVGLGCALINDPDLLFLDEPSTGLDPQARRAVWDLILALKGEGKGLLLTTHYMEEAEVVADRVAIMDAGQIIAQGTPRQLIRDVIGGDLLQVECGGSPLQAMDQLSAKLLWLKAPQERASGFEVVVDDVGDKLGALMTAASACGIEVKRLEVRRATLEDVFLRLTGRSLRDA